MRKLTRKIAVLAILGVAAPVWAQSDAQDTATQEKAETSRAMRHHKPGGESASDKMSDAKDTAKANAAKARKKSRKAGRHAKKQAEKTKSETTGQ